jgi:hypothetical protein
LKITPRLAAISGLALVSLVLGSACGGESVSSRGGGQSGGAGVRNTAGATGSAGKVNVGGGSGGSGTVGVGASAGATSGGSSSTSEACTASPQTGSCEAAMPRWYHDAETGLCRPFIYGGCDGNANNYESLEACQMACAGSLPDYSACTVPTDCQISSPGCCGFCAGTRPTSHDFIAFNAKYLEQVYAYCSTVDVDCDPCTVAPEDDPFKSFVPNCAHERCIVEDLRTSSVTACTTAADCRLRFGTGCCEQCDAASVIAVRSDGSFEDLVCGDLLPPCAACDPQLPEGAVAACHEGHCVVDYLE